MKPQYKLCQNDSDFAKASLFIMENKWDLHAGFSTLDMVDLLYSYATEGRILMLTDPEERIIAVAAYYIGTPEERFTDRDIAFVDLALTDEAYRGTRLFVRGLTILAEVLQQEPHPIQELRFVAHSDNSYLCRLYRKFTTSSTSREGSLGPETVFYVTFQYLTTILNRYNNI